MKKRMHTSNDPLVVDPQHSANPNTSANTAVGGTSTHNPKPSCQEHPSTSPPTNTLANLIVCVIAAALGATMAAAGSSGGSSTLNLSATLQDIPVFACCVGLAFTINWVALPIAFLLETEKFYDITGGLTYITMAATAFGCSETRETFKTILLFALVILWALRLSGYLFIRALNHGDKRFDVAKTNFLEFAKFWTLQALWCTFTTAAALAAIVSTTTQSFPAQEYDWVLTLLGVVLWIAGFSMEAISDYQKSAFRANPSNTGKFIQNGLWSVSRHPNYVGETILWLGVALIAAPALTTWQFATLISPIFVFLLLRFGSGVPLLKKSADARWGGQEAYEQYKENVPIFFPSPLC